MATMNNQGGRPEQFNGNADIHNEVNPHRSDMLSMPDLNLPYQEIENSNIVPNNESNGAVELNISYSTSLDGSPQRFPDRLYGSNLLQYQGRMHRIAQIGMTSSSEDVGNNHDHNLNLSLSLSSHPSSSQGEGMNGVFSTDNRVLPFKRSYSDLASEHSLTGESSTRGAQLEIDQELIASSQANSNNNVMNVSYFRNELANIHQSSDFDAVTGHCTRLVSNIQNSAQTATAPQTVIRASRFLNNYSRGQHIALPNPAHLFNQSPFISFAGTADGAPSLAQPLGYAPNFIEPQRASPHISNIMSSRSNGPPLAFPVHFGIRSEGIAPIHNQSIIQGNLMYNSQYGRGNRANDRENLRFQIGTNNFVGNLLNHEQHGSSSRNVNLPNAPIPVTWLNTPRERQVPSEMGNHSRAQEVDRSNIAIIPNDNSRTANRNSLVSRNETQARGNVQPSITSLLFDRNSLLAEVRATAVQIREVAQRAIRVRRVIQILRTMRNLPPHGQGVAIQQTQDANMGLAEEQILRHIKHEKFELVGEQTLENKEACSICQEDYVNGEELGKLDCVHKFHINCIKQWLVIKNLCPICKQTALSTDGDDNE